MFKCQEIQNEYYLVADYRIKCFVGVWWAYAAIAAAGAILYTVGIPLGLFLLLRKNRSQLYLEELRKKNDDHDLSNHALVVRKYGAIYSALLFAFSVSIFCILEYILFSFPFQFLLISIKLFIL